MVVAVWKVAGKESGMYMVVVSVSVSEPLGEECCGDRVELGWAL